MEKLSTTDGLVISQKKEWGEIFTGFETKNKYAVMETNGNELYFAGEVDGNLLLRLFLKSTRPFTIDIKGSDGQTIISIKRPWRFYFHEADILDSSGKKIGNLKKRFSFIRRIYTVTDDSGNELFELFGPILHPWTFNIMKSGGEVGKITKKWSGFGKEIFTDADNFGVTFPREMTVLTKAILLGAVFLIDFVHFENKD